MKSLIHIPNEFHLIPYCHSIQEAQCISWLPFNIFAFTAIQFEAISEEMNMHEYICVLVQVQLCICQSTTVATVMNTFLRSDTS